MSNEWQAYPVGTPPSGKNWNSKCQKFDEVSHTAHVYHAIEMAREMVIRGRLIYDESKLNEERWPVVWLSPNRWNSVGSRYGSVEFWFDWERLLKNVDSFWVEAIKYSPVAPRFLLANDSKDLPVAEYDPSEFDGPWAFDESKGIHYRNGEVTLEFMFSGDLPLTRLKSISFVGHSEKYCCLKRNSPKSCLEHALHADTAREMFVSGLISRNIHGGRSLFRERWIAK